MNARCLWLWIYLALFSIAATALGQPGGNTIVYIAQHSDRNQAETAVAVHPHTPSVVMATWMDREGTTTGGFRAGYAFSVDGGVTWDTGRVRDEAGVLVRGFDPSCAFGRDGRHTWKSSFLRNFFIEHACVTIRIVLNGTQTNPNEPSPVFVFA